MSWASKRTAGARWVTKEIVRSVNAEQWKHEENSTSDTNSGVFDLLSDNREPARCPFRVTVAPLIVLEVRSTQRLLVGA